MANLYHTTLNKFRNLQGVVTDIPFGEDSFNDIKNTSVSTASIEYILSTKRFDVPLYQN